MKTNGTAFTRGLIAGVAMLGALSLSPLPNVTAVHAGGPGRQDACAAPLPTGLAFTGGGGPNFRMYTLRRGGATLKLTQFGPRGLVGELRLLGGKPQPNDAVAEFTLILANKAHIYGGPTHVFQHGSQQHVCRSGAVEVDAHGNTTQQANPYQISLRLDGTITGRHASVVVWIAGTRYAFSGRREV